MVGCQAGLDGARGLDQDPTGVINQLVM
ncbi:hypothetical protein NSPZN2_11127 [Nitrospira defluvii]|uniref:Uncharacterized protein n=1 Tax=Nitrospira defluvii TaxID=330214 RepID=A0ABN7KRW2_9BACT|nr:hypothetical protein NSPZN2_11127 [Nitrospira defluvii]